jgi:hypothetical protein
MLFSESSQDALKFALNKATGIPENQLSPQDLEELSLGLLTLTSSVLKMRMRQRSIGRPVPGTGENSPQRIKERKQEQMSLFDTDLDGQGGGATPNGAC